MLEVSAEILMDGTLRCSKAEVFGAIAVLDVDIGWEIRMKHLFLNLPT